MNLAKYSKKAAADTFLLRATIAELRIAQEKKARRNNRTQGHYGNARVMDSFAVQEREAEQVAKEHRKKEVQLQKQLHGQETQFQKTFFNEFGRLGPAIFEVSVTGKAR